jgi:hypothetical protein
MNDRALKNSPELKRYNLGRKCKNEQDDDQQNKRGPRHI